FIRAFRCTCAVLCGAPVQCIPAHTCSAFRHTRAVNAIAFARPLPWSLFAGDRRRELSLRPRWPTENVRLRGTDRKGPFVTFPAAAGAFPLSPPIRRTHRVRRAEVFIAVFPRGLGEAPRDRLDERQVEVMLSRGPAHQPGVLGREGEPEGGREVPPGGR